MKNRDINKDGQRYYDSAQVSQFYVGRDFLYSSEEFIFENFNERIRNKDILDIGVGGGRTTPFLDELGKSYVGVDYSPNMIQGAEERYPGIDFRLCDATDMKIFGDGAFDVAFFSACGIDYVEPEPRARIIGEAHRVLRSGGLFIFSTHNMEAGDYRAPHRFRGLQFHRNPLKLVWENLKQICRYPVGIWNYARIRSGEHRGDGWALRADMVSNYTIIMYCITCARQVEALEGAGFADVRIVGFRSFTTPEEHRDDRWFYYIATKS